MDRLPTTRELQALKILWRCERCTVRDVLEALREAESEDLAYTTVLSLMQTMERKGLIARETEGRGKTHYFHALAAPEPTLRMMAGQFLDSVFDGAMSQYLVRALESRSPSLDELNELSNMISEARQRATSDSQT